MDEILVNTDNSDNNNFFKHNFDIYKSKIEMQISLMAGNLYSVSLNTGISKK